MAGMEKICEITGAYFGGKMHAWKHDLIQVTPFSRHLFRTEDAVLLFFTEPYLTPYTSSGPSPFLYIRIWKRHRRLPKFWTRFYWQWRKAGMFYRKEELTWDYVVYTPSLPGLVQGEYWGRTHNPKRALKKIGKLFEGRHLEVDSVFCSKPNWIKRGVSLAQMYPDLTLKATENKENDQ